MIATLLASNWIECSLQLQTLMAGRKSRYKRTHKLIKGFLDFGKAGLDFARNQEKRSRYFYRRKGLELHQEDHDLKDLFQVISVPLCTADVYNTESDCRFFDGSDSSSSSSGLPQRNSIGRFKWWLVTPPVRPKTWSGTMMYLACCESRLSTLLLTEIKMRFHSTDSDSESRSCVDGGVLLYHPTFFHLPLPNALLFTLVRTISRTFL